MSMAKEHRPSNGGGNLEINSTESMMSNRDHGLEREVDEVLSTFADVYDQYGAQVNEIQLAEISKGSALAFYDHGDSIAFNKAYFNSDKMNKVYDNDIKNGFHPSRGDKTALQAIAAHELGHKLTNDVAKRLGSRNLDSAAKTIMEDARKTGKFKGVFQMGKKISGYAATSNAESISEAFADVFCNGGKAKAESKAVVNSLNKYLGK